MWNLPKRTGLVNSLWRMIRDNRGVSAVAFAITFAVLAPMTMATFDVYQMNEQRGKLQDALDAAALYAARSTATTTKDIDIIGDKALLANLKLIPGATLQSSDFTLVTTGDAKVVAVASVRVPALAPDSFTHNPVSVNTEVTRAGNNLEVALVLDNSTSMAGASLTSLKSAANQLVDLVVGDAQSPYYSKVSIIPYGNGVNVGTYAAAARGATQSGTNGTAGTNGSPPNDNFKFVNTSGSNKTFAITTCVSERTGAQAYTDASPSSAPVGLNYGPGAGNPCISAQMAPLSSDKPTLHTSIGNLTSCCSTGGHIGVAWGWYTLSPNWNQVFTGNAAPAAYGTPHTIKALVLMTDGEYNSVYCKGVIAQDSTTGSGSSSDHINCNGTNGADAYAQAQSLCTAMKAAPNNVVIYTVGLNVLAKPEAQNLVNNCATDAKHVYLPADGTAMTVAFQQIAADLQRLRLSH
ncbi:pilus assembly protein TadG-related protein [Phenylobacterium sp.]|uniref:pilus assembly protein TadG-related protein n=1 Tax=Phenylobacterium sp. TaxID=1871053 RepID=UPI003561BA6A